MVAGQDQIEHPAYIFVDATDTLFVADRGNHRVVKWSGGVTESEVVVEGLNSPYKVVLDATTSSFVIAEQQLGRVVRWHAQGSEVEVVAEGVFDPSFPCAIAVDGYGNVYIGDTVAHSVQQWSPGATSGTVVAGGQGVGMGMNQLAYPSDVLVESTGALFVSEHGNHRVTK